MASVSAPASSGKLARVADMAAVRVRSHVRKGRPVRGYTRGGGISLHLPGFGRPRGPKRMDIGTVQRWQRVLHHGSMYSPQRRGAIRGLAQAREQAYSSMLSRND